MVTEQIYCDNCHEYEDVQVGTEHWARNLCYNCEEEYQTVTKQKEMAEKLLRLMKENPDHKVIPMVETEVVADDCFSSWAGSFGEPKVDEVYSEDERIYFRSIDEDELMDSAMDNLDIEHNFKLLEKFTDDTVLAMAKEVVDNFNWEKAIIVPIGTPV